MLLVTRALLKMENGCTNHQIINQHDHIYAINAGAIFANFTVLAHKQEECAKLMASEPLRVMTQQPNENTTVFNKLIQADL